MAGARCNSGTLVALKQIKLTPELCGSEGFLRTALREINVLLNLRHDNIKCRHEIVVGGSNDSRDGAQIFMVMDYIPVELGHMLAAMGDDEPLSLPDCKCLVRQLCAAVSFLHGQCAAPRHQAEQYLVLLAGQHLGRLWYAISAWRGGLKMHPDAKRTKTAQCLYSRSCHTLLPCS